MVQSMLDVFLCFQMLSYIFELSMVRLRIEFEGTLNEFTISQYEYGAFQFWLIPTLPIYTYPANFRATSNIDVLNFDMPPYL